MKEIEEGLHELHASARDTKKDTSEEEMDTSHGTVFVLIVSITPQIPSEMLTPVFYLLSHSLRACLVHLSDPFSIENIIYIYECLLEFLYASPSCS